MSKYYDKFNGCAPDHSTVVYGNSVDVDVKDCESEIRADVVVAEFEAVRLWGQVRGCDGKPVAGALLKLVRVIRSSGKVMYKGIAHAISDCEGFYQFDICPEECGDGGSYKILVNKAAVGPERVISVSESNCDPCDAINSNLNPCYAADCGHHNCYSSKPYQGKCNC